MMMNIVQQYRQFLLPLVMVLIFDLGLLAMNYVISAQLEKSSVDINIAGRQRMLTQKMTKALLLMHDQKQTGESNEKSRQELLDAILLFQQTFSAFYTGGIATSASGELIEVSKQTLPAIRTTLDQTRTMWTPLHRELNAILSGTHHIAPLIPTISQQNLQLLDLMNKLTNQLEQQAKRKTYLLRGIQTLVVLMILVSFFIAVNRLVRRERYYRNLMEKSSDIVVGIDVKTAKITFISASVKLLLDNDDSFYLDKPIEQLFSQQAADSLNELLRQSSRQKALPYFRCETELIKRDGRPLTAEMLMQLSVSEDGRHIELCADIRDISERKQLELALADLAHKDSLTGLPNRTLFTIMADRALNLARRNGTSVGIMFIDLDDFKNVNDNEGHHIGDALLIEVAKRIESNLRSSDSVSRLGGDEFVVLLDSFADKQDISFVADKIIRSLSVPFVIEGKYCQIGASIGVARYPHDGLDLDTLLKRSDSVMYQVKKNGKNAVAFSG